MGSKRILGKRGVDGEVGADTTPAPHDVCLKGTHRHRLRCAQLCAQTQPRNHHSAPNANQGPNEKRA
jgi:hypothetical protein